MWWCGAFVWTQKKFWLKTPSFCILYQWGLRPALRLDFSWAFPVECRLHFLTNALRPESDLSEINPPCKRVIRHTTKMATKTEKNPQKSPADYISPSLLHTKWKGLQQNLAFLSYFKRWTWMPAGIFRKEPLRSNNKALQKNPGLTFQSLLPHPLLSHHGYMFIKN